MLLTTVPTACILGFSEVQEGIYKFERYIYHNLWDFFKVIIILKITQGKLLLGSILLISK